MPHLQHLAILRYINSLDNNYDNKNESAQAEAYLKQCVLF